MWRGLRNHHPYEEWVKMGLKIGEDDIRLKMKMKTIVDF